MNLGTKQGKIEKEREVWGGLGAGRGGGRGTGLRYEEKESDKELPHWDWGSFNYVDRIKI